MNDLKSTERFSNRVDNYVKYRPHYPKEIIDYLNETIFFNPNFYVADVGSGTGILSGLFIANNNKLFAVEPNAAMRLKAEELFNKFENFRSIDGKAEETTLDEDSVNFIIAGQAFHWFDAEKTKLEFKKISKRNSYCALVWNERQTVSDLEKDYESFLLKYSNDYTDVNHTNITSEKINGFFSPENVVIKEFSNHQIFDFKSLQGRVLSSSYIPLEDDTRFEAMIKDLQSLFDKYQHDGEIKFEYITRLYLGKIK